MEKQCECSIGLLCGSPVDEMSKKVTTPELTFFFFLLLHTLLHLFPSLHSPEALNLAPRNDSFITQTDSAGLWSHGALAANISRDILKKKKTITYPDFAILSLSWY